MDTSFWNYTIPIHKSGKQLQRAERINAALNEVIANIKDAFMFKKDITEQNIIDTVKGIVPEIKIKKVEMYATKTYDDLGKVISDELIGIEIITKDDFLYSIGYCDNMLKRKGFKYESWDKIACFRPIYGAFHLCSYKSIKTGFTKWWIHVD